MRTNNVRRMLREGKATVGCFLGLGSPNVAELLAHAGFDWLVVESEHNALDLAQIERMLMALNATNVVPLVRVPSADPLCIQRVLDVGAMGIVVPMVRTADEARCIVRATRYPPEGIRGFGPLRAAHYMQDTKDYFTRINENLLVALIIETREAVDNLEAIAATPGIDVIIPGPFDLCLSLGLDPMQQPHEEINQIIDLMFEVGQKHGIACGMHALSPDQMRQNLRRGFTFLYYGADYMMLTEFARAGIDAFRNEQANSDKDR